MELLLSFVAIVFLVIGLANLARRQTGYGLILISLGLLVGPAGIALLR